MAALTPVPVWHKPSGGDGRQPTFGLLQEKAPEQAYQVLKEIDDVRFGPSTLVRMPNNNLLMLEKLLVSDMEPPLVKVQRRCTRHVVRPDPSLVPIVDFAATRKEDQFGRLFKLAFYVVFPEIDLQKQFNENVQHGVRFTSEELTYLLYGGVFGLTLLEEDGVCHGKLNPNWMMVTKSGYSVVEDPADDKIPFHREAVGPLNLYLSPRAYAESFHQIIKPFDRHKDDVWALGLIILQCGLLKNIKNIYSADSPELDFRIVNAYLQEFERIYDGNTLLISGVRKMLEFNESDRPYASEVKARLPDIQSIQSHFEENKQLKLPPILSANPQQQVVIGKNGIPVVVQKEHREEIGAIQHLPDLPPQFPNFHLAQQIRETSKRLSMKSPHRIIDQPDRLTTTYKQLERPKISPIQSAANYQPGRLCEFYVTPGGNLLKKEQKFYENVDEATGQKKYQVFVEYNQLSPEESLLLREYYSEQALIDGRDKLPMFESRAVPLPPDATRESQLDTSPVNHSRGYKVVPPHSNDNAMALSLGLRPKTSDMFYPQVTSATGAQRGSMIETQQQSGGPIRSQGFSQISPPGAQEQQVPQPEKQLYQLGGRFYLGSTTIGPDGQEYLVVDTDAFTSELSPVQTAPEPVIDPLDHERIMYDKLRGKMHGLMGQSYPNLKQFGKA